MQRMPKLFDHGRKSLIFAIICLIMCQALALGGTALATRTIFANLYHAQSNMPTLALYGLALSALLYSLFRVLARKLSETLGQSYAIDFRKNFYTHLSLSSASVLAEKRIGALSIRFVGDLAAMRSWVSQGVTGVVSALIILPAALFTLWYIHASFLWVVSIPIVLAFFTMLLMGKQLKPVHTGLRSERANLAIDMMERVPAAPQMRLLGRANADLKLLEKRGHSLLSLATERALYLESLKSLPDIGAGMAGVLLLWLTASSDASAASAAAGLAVLGLVALPMRELATAWDLHCSWSIAKEKSEQIFAKTPLSRNSEGSKFSGRAVAVSAENICLFLGTQAALEINFAVPAGQSLAISVGSEYKQPLLNVLATLDDPATGKLLLADVPVPEIALNHLPRAVHYLSLSAPILQGSLRRALVLGVRKRPDDEKLYQLIEKYQLTDTLARLGSLSARIWENGRNLSLDEKFRVLLVRAYLSRPQYILIDDPRNQLNAETRRLLRNFIKSNKATRIVVTQSKAIKTLCDQSVRFNHAKVISTPVDS